MRASTLVPVSPVTGPDSPIDTVYLLVDFFNRRFGGIFARVTIIYNFPRRITKENVRGSEEVASPSFIDTK